ncbi:MAG: 50S ribosomal protein L11 methyltransferase [Chloroflexota bacterium]|nr:50S ribosomal protein L11 methyltransferase [Dehalococcoidia bacterium]MDW8046059.1 50S ribosomal protein L11 methyltransferase [Chloroflexota bacterium]
MSGLWFELTASAPPPLVEAVAAIFQRHIPAGVSIEEPIEPLGPERGFRVVEGLPVLVRAYVPSSELGAVVVSRLQDEFAALPEVELVARPLYERDWQTSWREFFGVVRTGSPVTVVPTWVEHTPAPGEVVIRLDPGQAFGTGHHETTRLCLAALAAAVRPGCRVLDVGTGSGILAIAAAKLGARSVDACDIDPVAVDVARANADANGVADAVRVVLGSLAAAADGAYEVAVANINTEADVALAPALAAALTPGGVAIVSGFLAGDLPVVGRALRAAGFALRAARHEGEWALLEAALPS